MSGRRVHAFSLILSLGTAVAVACGGPNDGKVNIVDADGGSSGSGARGGSGGSGNGSGDAGESSQGGGVGGEGEVPVLPEPPVVVSVTPSEDELAEPTGSIEIEFSEGLDSDTITAESIHVTDGENQISGTLDYSGVTVTFTPDERLDLLGSYALTVTTDVTDAGGTAMEEAYETTFQVRDGVWSEETVVENDPETGALYKQLISPVIDARGNALVVWGQAKSTEPGTQPMSVWGRFFHPGEGWSDAFEIDQSEYDCTGASVAMGPGGDAVVAWQQYEEGVPQVVARRYVDGDWGSAGRIDSPADTPTTGYVVTTAVSPTGEAHVLWNFNNGSYAVLKASHVAGDESWSDPQQIGFNDYLGRPAVAFNPDGNGFAFLATEAAGSETQLYAVRYIASNGAWNPNGDNIVDSADAAPQEVSVVADDQGGAHALHVRRDTVSLTWDVMSTTFTKAGGYSSSVPIDNLMPSPSSIPRLSTNGVERLASWTQFASNTENIYSALSDGSGYAEQDLRSNGDYDANYGDAVSGMDRRANGVLLFAQEAPGDIVDVMFARLAGGEWAETVKINQAEAEYQDARVAVAANGVAVAAWSIGIRQTPDSILVSTFE